LVFLEIVFAEIPRFADQRSTPPPSPHEASWKEPARARPVPFCRHGFLFVPETSPSVLGLQAVPLRCAARYAVTASWTACVPLTVFDQRELHFKFARQLVPALFLMEIFMAR
jgi:hypothetical protein